MITKLIIFIIVVNVIGSMFKNWQEKKRKQARILEGSDGQPPPASDEPVQESGSPFASEPEDLFAALMGTSDKQSRDKAAEYAAPPPVSAPEPQATEPAFEPSIMEDPIFGVEYDKIRAGKSLIDTKEGEKKSPFYLIQPETVESAASTIEDLELSPVAVTRDNTMGPRRLFTRGGLRQGIIFHEILGKPKGLL